MIKAIADTHTIIWYIFGDSRLSVTAKTFFESITNNGDLVGISSISLIEMVYLIEKSKIAAESLSRLAIAMSNPNSGVTEVSVDIQIARALSRVDVIQVPDMPDRIIAATAVQLGIPLISRDSKIRVSNVPTIW